MAGESLKRIDGEDRDEASAEGEALTAAVADAAVAADPMVAAGAVAGSDAEPVPAEATDAATVAAMAELRSAVVIALATAKPPAKPAATLPATPPALPPAQRPTVSTPVPELVPGPIPEPIPEPAPAQPAAAADAGLVLSDGPTAARVRTSGNPLLTAAAPVIGEIIRWRSVDGDAAPDGLDAALIRLLEHYEDRAEAAGLGRGEVQVGRFALAATLDDILRTRRWAGNCGWLQHGLAAAGPERFFDLMRVMLKHPARHRDALGLFYVCLSLGFEGRFRGTAQGGHELARIRDQLFRVLRRLSEAGPAGAGRAPLAVGPAQPLPVAAPYRPPPRVLMLRPFGGALLLAAVVGYFLAAWELDTDGGALAARLAAMLPDNGVATVRSVALPPVTGPVLARRITQALAPDVRAGALEVMAGTDGALVVRLSGGAVFPAGSDAVRALYRAVIDRVGLVLALEPGRIVVVAHTDSWALATDRFPDARRLTEARAEAVRALLEKRVGGLRLSAEGRGDSEPVDTNDTPGGRAANRRIDIRLYP